MNENFIIVKHLSPKAVSVSRTLGDPATIVLPISTINITQQAGPSGQIIEIANVQQGKEWVMKGKEFTVYQLPTPYPPAQAQPLYTPQAPAPSQAMYTPNVPVPPAPNPFAGAAPPIAIPMRTNNLQLERIERLLKEILLAIQAQNAAAIETKIVQFEAQCDGPPPEVL